jgi:hypothetical protein
MASTTDTSLTISNAKPATPAMDFAFLREQGINYIQSMSSDLWTDFNLHDPGVTILEVVSFAITDIASRANKAVPDLLASKPGAAPTEKDFFSAAEILPCSQVTMNDFRKILIDQDKIRNAWVSVSQDSEQLFYLDRSTNSLTYTAGEQIKLNGLYNVLLEFEEDKDLGDLNNSLVEATGISGGTMEVAFPYWDQVPTAWTTDLSFNSITLEDVTTVPGEKLRPLDDGNSHDYFAIMDVTYNVSTMDRIPVTVKVTGTVDETTIMNKLQETAAGSLAKVFNQKVMAANVIVAGIRKFLGPNRNVCEDFFAFKATRVQEIAVNMTLKVASGVNVEQTLAEIFHRLDVFLSPPIRFYTLDQMLAMTGATPDNVFEGPLLRYGFILDADLVEVKRSTIVFTSDMIRIILELNNDFNYGNSAFMNQAKGIIAVEDLTLANYIDNQAINTDIRNCLSLSSVDTYKPRLSIEKSNITVVNDQDLVDYDISLVETIFQSLVAPAKPAIPPPASDLPVPGGSTLPVEDYYSIQNDFPLVYGIGKSNFPASAAIERQAQAWQLKAFLLFFEQLLANYLAQLAHVKDLFSLNAGVNETYFFQLLDSVPDAAPLLQSGYPASLPTLLAQEEQSPTAISRRNNFLDHLLARFGEDFTDFALLTYAKNPSGATAELINDKSVFLEEYGTVSYNRAKSFDYTDAAPWGTDNVPWLKRRICGLLGIATYADQDLAGGTSEGFHMIEHILLRPKIHDIIAGNTDLFLNVPLDDGGNVIETEKDPYSFRITFVFPSWPARFADPDIQKYIEKIIQRETPAHILARTYWLDTTTMGKFETAFKAWLVQNANPTNETTLTAAKNQFITVLNGLT